MDNDSYMQERRKLKMKYMHLYQGGYGEVKDGAIVRIDYVMPSGLVSVSDPEAIDAGMIVDIADVSVLHRTLDTMTKEEFEFLFNSGGACHEDYVKQKTKEMQDSMFGLHKFISEMGRFETIPYLLKLGFWLFYDLDIMGQRDVDDRTGYEFKNYSLAVLKASI